MLVKPISPCLRKNNVYVVKETAYKAQTSDMTKRRLSSPEEELTRGRSAAAPVRRLPNPGAAILLQEFATPKSRFRQQ